MSKRIITQNPPDANCDLIGSIVEIVDVFRWRKDRERPIAVGQLLSIGPHYSGQHMRPGKNIFIYRRTTRKA